MLNILYTKKLNRMRVSFYFLQLSNVHRDTNMGKTNHDRYSMKLFISRKTGNVWQQTLVVMNVAKKQNM